MRVWELRSGQAVHVMASPAKGPVTGLLVLDRPPFLAAFGNRGGGGESGGQPQIPSATFCTSLMAMALAEGFLGIIWFDA